MIGYELWETLSGNLLEAFDAEGEALAAVVRTAARYGDAAVETFALMSMDTDDEDGDVTTIAAGAELLARARSSGAPNERARASR